MAGLSIVLGGLSGPGGATAAREVIDKNINQDIDLQKANLNKQKGDLSMLQQYAKDLQQKGVDDINITKSMQAMANNSLANQFKAMSAQLEPTDKAKAKILAEMGMERADKSFKLQAEVAKHEGTKVTTTRAPLISKMEEKPPLDSVRLGNLEAAQGSIKAYSKIKDLLKDPKVRDKIGRISGVVNKIKASWFGDADSAVLASNVDTAVLKALKEATGAQMTDAERAYIIQTLPSVTENVESFEAKLLDRLQGSKEQYVDQYSRYGRHFDVGGFMDPKELQDDRGLGFKER
jgi:hypothetical protein